MFVEGKLVFEFPDPWKVCRFGKTSFYLKHFQSFCAGCKEMDFALFDPGQKVLWLVEVKDYRIDQQTKPITLAEEVALKVRDSLALLRIAQIRDETPDGESTITVGEFARGSAAAIKIRVVLHCDLPQNRSKLFPGVKDSANLQQELRIKLRCIDPHAQLVDLNSTGTKCAWSAHSM